MAPPRGNGSSSRVGEHRCAGIPPTSSGGQESFIPYELLLSFLFPCQPLLLCRLVSRSTFPYFLFLHHFLQFYVLPVLSRTFPPKVLLSRPAPAYLIPFLFTLPPVLPCCGFYLFCVCIVFFFPFFYRYFPKKCI